MGGFLDLAFVARSRPYSLECVSPIASTDDSERGITMIESSSDAPLKWDLFLTSGIPTVTSNPPPGEKRRFFSPISSTLI